MAVVNKPLDATPVPDQVPPFGIPVKLMDEFGQTVVSAPAFETTVIMFSLMDGEKTWLVVKQVPVTE